MHQQQKKKKHKKTKKNISLRAPLVQLIQVTCPKCARSETPFIWDTQVSQQGTCTRCLVVVEVYLLRYFRLRARGKNILIGPWDSPPPKSCLEFQGLSSKVIPSPGIQENVHSSQKCTFPTMA